jgi:hypothetical protein
LNAMLDTADRPRAITGVPSYAFRWDELAGVRVWCGHSPYCRWPYWMRPDRPPGLLTSALQRPDQFLPMFVGGPLGALDSDEPEESALLRLVASFFGTALPARYGWIRLNDLSWRNWREAWKSNEHRLAHLIMLAWQEEAAPLVESWMAKARAQAAAMEIIGYDNPELRLS